jgi:ABC-type transport system involved in cytochrome c biogenesis permease subunit
MTSWIATVRLLLLALIVVLAASALGLTAYLAGSLAEGEGKRQASAPARDSRDWHQVPVYDGRVKPLLTACADWLRQITGHSHWPADPVSVVLDWSLGDDQAMQDWEHFPFILCDHQGLRSAIFSQEGPGDHPAVKGKYVSPAQLRSSPAFDRLLEEVARERRASGAKASARLSTVHRKAEEVAKRLALYDALRGQDLTRLHRNLLWMGNFVSWDADADGDVSEIRSRLQAQQTRSAQPLRWVCLGELPGRWWLSLEELRAFRDDPERWRRAVEERLAENPRPFLPPAYAAVLSEFEAALQAGTALDLCRELADVLAQKRQQARTIVLGARDANDLQERLSRTMRTAAEREAIRSASDNAQEQGRSFEALREELAEVLEQVRRQSDEETLTRLEQQVLQLAGRSRTAETELLGLSYLEARFPHLYQDLGELPFPRETADRLLASWDRLRAAYRQGDDEDFRSAAVAFRQELRAAADPDYLAEVERWIPWELVLDQTRPFRWAWVLMLAAAAAFALQMNTGWQLAYRFGWFLAIAGLAVQAFGFGLRSIIAGRAPVGNLYETVICVAFLAAVFAAVLELIYRRTVIVLAGCGVAVLGLMLADQLPLVLDPAIGPLAPVLRNNFWLTVHVVTIVASYAAATLAWGLGNVSLALLAFGRPQPETLRSLALYTYRALQITVVLLASGTVLGAWWASEAWGRYWGWDPKETGAVIALLGYVIPLHARYVGWIREFGLAVAAVLCYAGVILSWYVINFVIAAGLHSYGFGGGGGLGMLWAGTVNLLWLAVASWKYLGRTAALSEAK